MSGVSFPRPGDIFVGRYRVQRLIGRGGFAHVYGAIQVDLEREVAIKILKPLDDDAAEPGGDEALMAQTIARFQREAKLVSRLRDPHTITMYDYGQSPDGLLYMVMELVNGVSLSKMLADGGAMSAERTVHILLQVLSSLQEAHTYGILHRDLKPSNIMVYDHIGRKDQVKLLDFGIAKHALRDAGNTQELTRQGVLLGTPRYMSPEQIRAAELGPPSDIYSLGLVTYEMLRGEKAVAGLNSIEIIGQQLAPTPIELPADPTVPETLRRIVNHMLAKDPARRYQSVDHVIQDLEPLAMSYSGVHRQVQPTSAPAGRAPDATVEDISDRVVALDPVNPPPANVRTRKPIEDSVNAFAPSANGSRNPKRSGAKLAGAALALVILAAAAIAVIHLRTLHQSTAGVVDHPGTSARATHEAATHKHRVSKDGLVANMVVSTRPPHLMVAVDGKNVGRSPASINPSSLHFPVTISATGPNGARQSVTVAHARPTLLITLATPAPGAAVHKAKPRRAAATNHPHHRHRAGHHKHRHRSSRSAFARTAAKKRHIKVPKPKPVKKPTHTPVKKPTRKPSKAPGKANPGFFPIDE